MSAIGWILLVLFGVIVLTFFVPVRIQVEHIQAWHINVRMFGVVTVWSFPSEKKSKDEHKDPEKKNAKSQDNEKKPTLLDELKSMFKENGVGGVAAFFSGLMKLLTETLCSLARFITVRKLVLCIRAGKEEPDETAVFYSRLCAATATGLAVLSQTVRVKKTCVRVIPDFLSEKSDVRLRVVVWIWPFGVAAIGIKALIQFVLLLPKSKALKPKQSVSE